MPTVVVPDLGDVTDPETIQDIYDDLTAIEDDIDDIADTGRCIARGRRVTNSTAAAAETSVLRVDDIPVVNGRLYHITTNPLQIDSTVANDICRINLRIDETGADATTASTVMALTQLRQTDAAQSEQTMVGAVRPASANGLWSVLLTTSRPAGTGNISLVGGATIPIDLLVIDLGPDPTDTGVDL